ncbi:MAG: hypothetical protein Q4D57_06375 [Clostridia bacterium]|nr:hypothetical protein [Clostridia bacterium]
MVKAVVIVSLSSRISGKSYVKYEVDLEFKRLRSYSLKVKFMSASVSKITSKYLSK